MKTENIARSTIVTEYLRHLWSRPVAIRIMQGAAPSRRAMPSPSRNSEEARNGMPPAPSLRPGLIGRAILILLLLVIGGGTFGPRAAYAQANGCPETNVQKYVQMPQTDGGFDLWDTGPWALADDFICTNTGPITDIHLWGAWLNDAVDLNTTFWLAIYDDVPAITNGPAIIPSRPGTNLVWQQYFTPGQYSASQVAVGIGNFYNPEPPGLLGNDSKVYYYCFYPTNPPTQTGTLTQSKTYWLAVYAMPSQGTGLMFGWKSAKVQQNDISTRTPWPGIAPITPDWRPNYDPSSRGLDLAFKINTATNTPQPCCPENNGVKFVQHPKVPGGLDVNASQNLVLADDFQCTNSGPITDIHLWGSWLQDNVDPGAMFTLSIWSDVPKQTNAAGVVPSHPGVVLWSEPFGPGEYNLCPYTNTTEQFFDPSLPAIIGGDSKVYYLCFYPRNPFRQQGTTAAPTNYWLSVNAQTTAGAQMLFGWHTSYEFYNDVAVWGTAPFPAAWNTLFDLQGIPLSMAFKLNTVTNSPCPPGTIICPPNKTVECGSNWTFDDPQTTNACCGTNMTLTILNTTTNGFCPQIITRTWQVTDCSGFTANCSQTVTVQDTTPPVFTYCPTNRTVECGSQWQFDTPIVTDNCCLQGVFLFGTFTNTSICPQVITRIWEAQDCCGNTNTCTQTITVVDTIPPVFTYCPTNLTVECGNPFEFGTPAATDNCCLQGISVLGTFTNGTCPQFITRVWVAKDCCGNTNTCTQTVTIVDTTPPTLTCSTNKTVECGTPWTFDPPIATDNCCTPVVNVLNTITNGSCPQVITRVWVAYDCCGNSNTCGQVVVVRDTTPPTLTCATNKTVQCGTPWTFDPPTAADNCCTNPAVSVVDTITNGSPCDYTISRTWVAVDCCQNRSTPCTQTVRVVDTLPPVITCPTNMIVDSCDTNVVVTWSIHATDNCSTNVTVTSTPPSGSTFTRGTTNTIHVVATDGCGNTNTCDFTLLVERPRLTITYSSITNTVTLYWSDGILQGADDVLGPYSDIPLATSPYTVSAIGPHRFYRLRCP